MELQYGNQDNPTTLLVLLHGRGASAASILSLVQRMTIADSVLVVAPHAPQSQWYPERFIVPTEENQPYLDASLQQLAELIGQYTTQHDIDIADVHLAGFSQGACLAAEYVKRHPARYGSVTVMSGGLIGSDAEVVTEVVGDLAGTPIYIGCDEVDFHIPIDRVHETARYFTEHGAQVAKHIYVDLGHTVHPDAIDFLEQQLS